jgi:hypothetical protein
MSKGAHPSAAEHRLAANVAPDFVTALALAYLALPLVLFVGGWFRPLPALALLAFCGVIAWRCRTIVGTRVMTRRHSHILQVLVFACLWAALGGGSHFVYANPDWVVRDAVLADLAQTGWPPAYETTDATPQILRSAIGFLLPVALSGKLLGVATLPFATFVWTALGLTLFLLLLPLPRRSWQALLAGLLIIALFSGMDIVGIFLLHGHYAVFPLRLEWWAEYDFRGAFTYSSLMAQLLWAPNHALPMWLATALLYRHWRHPNWPTVFATMLPSLPLWTPFALPGLAPFLIVCAIASKRLRNRLANVDLMVWLSSAILLTAVLSVQLLGAQAMPLMALNSGSTASAEPPLVDFLRNYTLFILMEFVCQALVLYSLLKHSRPLFWTAFLVLATLPFVHFGPSNDLLLRGSTPALIILAILTMQTLTDNSTVDTVRKSLLAMLCIVGAHSAANEIARALLWTAWKPDYSQTLPATQHGALPAHYVGSLSDPILRSLLRPPSNVDSNR